MVQWDMTCDIKSWKHDCRALKLDELETAENGGCTLHQAAVRAYPLCFDTLEESCRLYSRES